VELLNTENKNNNLITGNLNRHLFLLITVMLILVMIFVISSFIINIVAETSYADMENVETNTVRLTDLFSFFREAETKSAMLPYLGMMMLIAIPAIGLLYVTGYFIYKKNVRFALIGTGVLSIIILSLVIGFTLL
jgi:hypothetical protein